MAAVHASIHHRRAVQYRHENARAEGINRRSNARAASATGALAGLPVFCEDVSSPTTLNRKETQDKDAGGPISWSEGGPARYGLMSVTQRTGTRHAGWRRCCDQRLSIP